MAGAIWNSVNRTTPPPCRRGGSRPRSGSPVELSARPGSLRPHPPSPCPTVGTMVRRFMRHFPGRDPRDMGSEEVNVFLSSLAIERSVSASTQNQAAAALLFLYRDGYKKNLEGPSQIIRAKHPRTFPVVLKRRTLSHFRELPGLIPLVAGTNIPVGSRPKRTIGHCGLTAQAGKVGA